MTDLPLRGMKVLDLTRLLPGGFCSLLLADFGADVVKVEDTGEAQEVQVKVTLTIQQQPTPIVKTQVIDSINPGEQKTVTFRNLGQVQFATKTVLKVDVKAVPGEKTITNNSAEYPVIFSLG